MLRLFHICSLILLTKQARKLFKNRSIQINERANDQCDKRSVDIDEDEEDNRRMATKSRVDECMTSIETCLSVETSRDDERIRTAEVMPKFYTFDHPTSIQIQTEWADSDVILVQNNDSGAVLVEQNSPRLSSPTEGNNQCSVTDMESPSKKIRSSANRVTESGGVIRDVGLTEPQMMDQVSLEQKSMIETHGLGVKDADKPSNSQHNGYNVPRADDEPLDLSTKFSCLYTGFSATGADDVPLDFSTKSYRSYNGFGVAGEYNKPLDLSTGSYCAIDKVDTVGISRGTIYKPSLGSVNFNNYAQDETKLEKSTNDITKTQQHTASDAESTYTIQSWAGIIDTGEAEKNQLGNKTLCTEQMVTKHKFINKKLVLMKKTRIVKDGKRRKWVESKSDSESAVYSSNNEISDVEDVSCDKGLKKPMFECDLDVALDFARHMVKYSDRQLRKANEMIRQICIRNKSGPIVSRNESNGIDFRENVRHFITDKNEEKLRADIEKLTRSIKDLLCTSNIRYTQILSKLKKIEIECQNADRETYEYGVISRTKEFLVKNNDILTKLFPKMKFFMDYYRRNEIVNFKDANHGFRAECMVKVLDIILAKLKKDLSRIEFLLATKVGYSVKKVKSELIDWFYTRYELEKILLYIIKPLLNDETFYRLLTVFYIESLVIFGATKKTSGNFEFKKSSMSSIEPLRMSMYIFLCGSDYRYDSKDEILYLEQMCTHRTILLVNNSFELIAKSKLHYNISLFQNFIVKNKPETELKCIYDATLEKYKDLVHREYKQQRKKYYVKRFNNQKRHRLSKKDMDDRKMQYSMTYSVIAYIFLCMCNSIIIKEPLHAFIYNLDPRPERYETLIKVFFSILADISDLKKVTKKIKEVNMKYPLYDYNMRSKCTYP